MQIERIIGDYNSFFTSIIGNLESIGIQVSGYPMSHLGYKAKTVEEYERVRDELIKRSSSMVENVHNGRPIAKIILRDELDLGGGFKVSLMEIMPPKNSQAQIDGLEHCGFVVGEGLTKFEEQYSSVLTGIQDQGPYCQPAYVIFNDGRRVKFYEHSLKKVVELEGRKFMPVTDR